jgi:hypothetical protein
MLRHSLAHVAGALAVVCGGLLLAPTAIAQPKQAARASMHDILAMEVDTKGLQESMTLKECLQKLYERIAKKGTEVPILVDLHAFKEANPDAQPHDDEVQLPAVPRVMKLAQVLQLLTSQIRTGDGAYVARNGVIEITTYNNAILPMLLQQRIVARFDKTPFNEVIRQLVEISGAPILIDPRLQEKAKAPITAELNGNVSLAALLPIIADMADLRVIRIASTESPRRRRAEAAAAAVAANPELVALRTVRPLTHNPSPPEGRGEQGGRPFTPSLRPRKGKGRHESCTRPPINQCHWNSILTRTA